MTEAAFNIKNRFSSDNMLYTSHIELSKSALNNNIRFMRDQVCRGAKYSMVIKANAYGHGIEDLLPMIEETGVTHFSVFSIVEAMRAYEVKRDRCELMIMGWLDYEGIEWCIVNDVSFYVFTIDRLLQANKASKYLKKPAKIHLELETGMHRTGFNEEELDQVLQIIHLNPECFEVEGLCTHFAGAETITNYERVKSQIKVFDRLSSELYNKGIKPKYRHTACSAAVLNYPEAVMDMVRVGIANYGFWPSDELRMYKLLNKEKNGEEPLDPLKQVLTWKSKVMSIKRVPSGEYISYGKTYLTNRDSVIAIIPVGYGYGFTRNLSNMGHILLHGKRVPVIGLVNMNMIVTDITDVENVKEGDEVVLIGSQEGRSISVSSFADMTNSLNYELLTRLPAHIPRKIVD